MKKTKVVFVLDKSGSMGHLQSKVVQTVNGYLESLRAASDAENYYEVGFIQFSNRASWTVNFTDVKFQRDLNSYDYRPEGSTALLDAISMALNETQDKFDRLDTAYLMTVVTDGQENSSVRVSKRDVKTALSIADANEFWTVVVNCPKKDVSYIRDLGVIAENIKPWEATEKGIENLSRATTQGLSTYTSSRSAGVTRTRAFYADTQNVDLTQVKASLDELPRSKVTQYTKGPKDRARIMDFFMDKRGQYDAGHVFYELIKSEKVQPQKEILILDEATQKLYVGWKAARALLNLPTTADEFRLRPGRMGNLKVFIKSTSWTRKLKDGQRVLHVDG